MTSLNNLIRLANSYANPDTKTLLGFKHHLIAWYCFQFNVPLKDPTLLSHTLEELAVLFFMFDIKQNPSNYGKIIGDKEADSYEEWLKQHMGDGYVSEEQMVEDMVDYAQRERDLLKKLPDKITTDFSNLGASSE